MAIISKNNTTNRTLTSTGCWEGGVVPGAADIARWYSASNAGGNHTGSLTILGLQFDGATADVAYTSGTLTLTQTDAFVNGSSNDRAWINNGGILALGSANRNFNIARTIGGFISIVLINAGSLTGSGTLSINNVSGTTNVMRMAVNGANTGFTGTIVLNDYTGISNWSSTAAILTACNITVSGVGCTFSNTSTPGYILGAAGKTLTINNSVTFDTAMTVASNVGLGSVLRTLTVNGNTGMTGTVTGTAGVTVAGASKYTYLFFDNATTSGLTGPCTVSSGDFIIRRTTAPYVPSTLSVAADARFFYYASTSDYTFDVTPTGLGTVCVSGNFAGNGVTFPASPTAGNIALFDGRVAMRPNSGNNAACKIRISELPASLGWLCLADGATTLSAATTYTGSGQTKSTSLLIDSEGNTNTATLTGSTYSLLSSGSGPLVLSGPVERTNSAGTLSARMSLTLGGTNTGDNTLSGDISEVGTNGAILGITKVDAGRWVLSGANSSHTGVHTISAGTLSAQSEKALGSATSAGGVTISGTGALELAGGITLDKSSTPFTIHQTSPIVSVGDNTVRTAGVTLGGTTTFEVTTGNRLAISNTGAITDGASTFGITKTGDGELALAAFTNTYDGVVVVSAGTLAIGSQGALGNGNVTLTGTLKYTGTGETYSRSTFLSGAAPSLEAAGSGAITVTNLSQNSTTKTLTLKGANTGANTVTVALSDSSNPLSLAKSGAGKWVTTGALSYSGSTTVSDGTLRVQTANSNTTSGAVTIAATGTVELVTDTLASTGGGAVLGSSHVAVNGGIIKTRGGTTQKGQMRYGGNLTFGADSSLYIGAAA